MSQYLDRVAAAIHELDAALAATAGDVLDAIRADPTVDYPPPVVDHDAQTVTFAVTFEWDRHGLHMDHCEVEVLAGDLQRCLIERYMSWQQIAGVRPVRTWEPLEERHIGSVQRTVSLRE